MLVHICCAVDSHYFLQRLREDDPDEPLIGFFYDPNIHPYSEYYLRLLEVRRSCRLLGIALVEGDYDTAGWLAAVRGLEHAPEKGARCSVCFDHRLEASAREAVARGEKRFTSTLLTSPKKSLEQLKASGEALGRQYGITFFAPDYRKNSGTQRQNIMAKSARLYRQDYCGCVFALQQQRVSQARLNDEMLSPVSGQIQPESIEERIALYTERMRLEEAGIPYTITRSRFLNWRLLSAHVRMRAMPIAAHVLPYSTLKKTHTRGRIEAATGTVHHFNRDAVKWITVATYNHEVQTNYDSVRALMAAPPPFETEVALRRHLLTSPYDLSTILVVDAIPHGTIELTLDARVYEDVRDVLVRGD